MTAWPNEVMLVPVDPDTSIRESFVAAVKCDVIIHLAFVIFRVLLRARHAGFFVRCEQEDEIAFGLDFGSVECANCRKQRFDVARVVTYAGRINASLADRGFDL